MPCLLCGAHQTDPARGASPWKRGVAAGEQVLVCPDCQSARDWTVGLDRCAECGSTSLVKSLGEVICRACAATGTGRPGAAAAGHPVPEQAGDPELAAAVDAAVRRLLSRPVDGGGRPRHGERASEGPREG